MIYSVWIEYPQNANTIDVNNDGEIFNQVSDREDTGMLNPKFCEQLTASGSWLAFWWMSDVGVWLELQLSDHVLATTLALVNQATKPTSIRWFISDYFGNQCLVS